LEFKHRKKWERKGKGPGKKSFINGEPWGVRKGVGNSKKMLTGHRAVQGKEGKTTVRKKTGLGGDLVKNESKKVFESFQGGKGGEGGGVQEPRKSRGIASRVPQSLNVPFGERGEKRD